MSLDVGGVPFLVRSGREISLLRSLSRSECRSHLADLADVLQALPDDDVSRRAGDALPVRRRQRVERPEHAAN